MKTLYSTLLAASLLLSTGGMRAGGDSNKSITQLLPSQKTFVTVFVGGLVGGALEKQTGFFTKLQDTATDNPLTTAGLASVALGLYAYRNYLNKKS